MGLQISNRAFKKRDKDIKYLNKDFTEFRRNLIEFSKTYFPKTYSDFNESSPGMLFIEMASYIGDVLSYYIDDSLKESLMIHAEDEENVLALAQYLGYVPKVTSPAIATLSVYQLVPSTDNGDKPDENYMLRIKEGMEVESSSTEHIFRTLDVIDFSDPSDRTITVFERDETTDNPTFYLVRKEVTAISGERNTKTAEFGSHQPFPTITLPEEDVIQIVDIRDDNGNVYYQVPYLGQEMVYVEEPNVERFHPDLAPYRQDVPSVLRLMKTARRYIARVNEDSTITITFGSGNPDANDEVLLPTFKNVGLGLPNSIDRTSDPLSLDPTNFLNSRSYGVAPTNTTITVTYLTGGGVSANVPSNDLTRIVNVEYEDDPLSYGEVERQLFNEVVQSVAVDNDTPASGGRGGETLEEIRENALANFASQNRAVTAKDYTVRALSMPVKYGNVAKAFAIADKKLSDNSPASILSSTDNLEDFSVLVQAFLERQEVDDEEVTQEDIKEELRTFLKDRKEDMDIKEDPFAVNLYVLGYDTDGKLKKVNKAVKENLKTYLNEYRLLTDGLNIVDGFIINLGINFEINTYPNYNKSEVVVECVEELKEYFNIDNWTFNQTINISELELLLANVEGVQSVAKLDFVNKYGGNYAPNRYDIKAATKDKIIYPSLDPSIFEIKFPDKDINGRAR